MNYLYLLDSNVVSEFSKPSVNENVVSHFKRKESFCAVSAITLQEMQMGMELLPDGKRKDQVRSFVEIVRRKFAVIPYDKRSAVVCGEILAEAQKAGKPRPICDTQIAATALANNMILVTRNVRDFSPMQKSTLLKVENWFE